MRTHAFTALAAAVVLSASASSSSVSPPAAQPRRATAVAIDGERFLINGRPTLEGRTWRGHSVEGLLPNSRMVQGTFDDLNADTRARFAYADTKTWDAARNTREFVAAMAEWRRHGLLAFTLNLQGGSPEGYSQSQPWHNSAFGEDGTLRQDYLARLELILDEADRLGMAVMLGLFYFGQDERLRDEAAVVRAVDSAVTWVLDRSYTNVLIEINNECNIKYDHAILQPSRVHELITRVRRTVRGGRRLLVSTSYGGNTIPGPEVVAASDYVLLHGNGVSDPNRIAEMVTLTRALPAFTPKPVVFNEDDHYDFDKPSNNFLAATSVRASWGFFDFRRKGEALEEGFQSVPVNWGISSARKRAFFGAVQGNGGPAVVALPAQAGAQHGTGKRLVRGGLRRGGEETPGVAMFSRAALLATYLSLAPLVVARATLPPGCPRRRRGPSSGPGPGGTGAGRRRGGCPA